MALHSTPEQHAANPPESWRVVREKDQNGSRVWWHLYIDQETDHPLQSYSVKREAIAALTSGFYFDLYQKEGRWFAGEKIGSWKSYAETLEEQSSYATKKAARERVETRKIERMGMGAARLAELRAEISSETFEVVQNAAVEMFDILDSGYLLDPDLLEKSEASMLYRELSDQWGFGSIVHDRIHRIKYSGLDGGKSTLEILEEMEQEEREATA